MKKIIILSALIFATAISALAQMGEKKSMTKAEEEVMMLAREVTAAVVKRDTAALERLLADDYAGMDFSMMFDKAQLIAMYKSASAGKFESVEPQETKNRIYGDAAVITSRALVKGRMPNDQTASMPIYVTMVAVRKNGRWQIVSTHLSRVMEPMPQMNNASNR